LGHEESFASGGDIFSRNEAVRQGSLERLLRPQSIAVVGGGAWCEAVIEQCRKIGFAGPLWAVHPTRAEVAGAQTFADPGALPGVPDAVFVGVNRNACVKVVGELAALGAGGAICFASGFLESGARDLNRALLEAAGKMPILGPNCYGILNYLDRVALWPDQHGGRVVETGVAILTQSSNIALNLTMQARGLPVAYVVTCGNQAQQGIADIAVEVLRDPRVTAVGLHVEGFGDICAIEGLAKTAQGLGKKIVVLKVGATPQAQAAAVSHTASMTGSDAGARALMARLGMLRATSLPMFLEALTLLHVHGPLGAGGLGALSCSGGEAGLLADAALHHGLSFPVLGQVRTDALSALLGPLVTLANPLDYHTFIWRDRNAMAQVFAAMTGDDIALTIVVLDFPRGDWCSRDDWQIATDAIADAARLTGTRFAALATLPENMPEEIAIALIDAGIAPLAGIDDAMAAIALACADARDLQVPILLPQGANGACHRMDEAAAKRALGQFGLACPKMGVASSPGEARKLAAEIGFPVVLKALGLAHKTENGAVALGLRSADQVAAAARAMAVDSFLVEGEITDPVAEVLIGVTCDPAHGYVLTLAAGGILAEVLRDQISLLIPSDRQAVAGAIDGLAISKLLAGYRGAPAGNIQALLDTVMAVQDYVIHNRTGLSELDINPVIITPTRAVAVDALIITQGP